LIAAGGTTVQAWQALIARHSRRLVLCAGVATLAAACTAAPAPQAPTAVVAATVDLPAADPAPANAQAAPAAPAAVAAAPVANSARALVGIGREALVARLGPANFVRSDGPAEVWRYRGPECYFEAFLYRDNLLGQRVAHVEARTLVGRPMAVETCFAQLGTPKQS
jgi:hypothetical protein